MSSPAHGDQTVDRYLLRCWILYFISIPGEDLSRAWSFLLLGLYFTYCADYVVCF